VRIAAIAAVVILGLVATGVAAAKTPKQTSLTGKISVLQPKTITVHGTRNLTCRITTASPKVRLRGFTLGSKARITCGQGVLLAIAKPKRAPVLTPAAPVTPATVTPVTPSDSTTVPKPAPTPGTGTVTPNPSLSIVGKGNISAISATSITIGTSVTCGFNPSSPSVSAFKAGDRVDYQCSAGILTKISPSID
jgi:hypothetical protein